MAINTRPTSANSLREGNHVLYNDEVCKILSAKHVRAGARGRAYVSVSVKGVISGAKYNFSYRSEEHAPLVEMVIKSAKYLFRIPDYVTVIIDGTDEVTEIASHLLSGEHVEKLIEFCNSLTLCFAGDELIYACLPDKMVVDILEADAVVKNQTASSSYKAAIVSGGVRVMVPQFVKSGDKIRISTEDLAYIEREG